ncbi:hypothetical protein AVEN_13224-2 [Araneus ventricosus]|uniref:E3 ubiquitin-protein ligase APD1-4 N-terminal domain-containing protein n=2 Tax=Araneus ventricosus TaxID=182803 RepID=A0A4Y2DMA7_ARAVE|nr:hypothetical protein AVEN_13224-2 [Araneus ventricosus]
MASHALITLVSIILAVIFFAVPLVVKYHVYKPQKKIVVAGDVITVEGGLSSIWCQGVEFSANSKFRSFLYDTEPAVDESEVVRTVSTYHITLPNKAQEYWGFRLLQGSSVNITSCARLIRADVTVVKGIGGLKKCLREHSLAQLQIIWSAYVASIIKDFISKIKLSIPSLYLIIDDSPSSAKDDSSANEKGMDSKRPPGNPDKENASVQKPPALEDTGSKEPQDLETLFNLYANFGDRDGVNGITLKSINKWLRQANVLDPKEGIAMEDTASAFAEVAKDKKRIDLDEFQGFIRALAISKDKDVEVVMNKILAAGRPKICSMSDFMMKICKGC